MASTKEALCSQCPRIPQPTLLMVTCLLRIAEGFPSECFFTRVQDDILNCGIISVSHFQNINSNGYKETTDNLTFILSKLAQMVMLLNDICEVPNLNHGHDTRESQMRFFANFIIPSDSYQERLLHSAKAASFLDLSIALVTTQSSDSHWLLMNKL